MRLQIAFTCCNCVYVFAQMEPADICMFAPIFIADCVCCLHFSSCSPYTVNAVASLVNGDELKVSTNVYSEWCTWEELAVYTSMPFRRVSFVRINTIGCATASKCIYCAALM